MDHLSSIHEHHRLASVHRCICGWEGDSAITHIVDALGLSPVEWAWGDAARGWSGGVLLVDDGSLPDDPIDMPLYRIRALG